MFRTVTLSSITHFLSESMASLKIEITRNLTEVVEVTGPMTMGRGKENDIILLDGIVSRHHARVYFDGADVLIEDLNSANGIFVNGDRVFLRALQDKDVIKIGKTKIYFSTEIWDSPPKVIDLMTNDISIFDMNEIINAPDIQFKFPSHDEALNQIYEIIRQKFELVEQLSDMDRVNLDAALNEAVGNAQRHGHKYEASLPIEFRYIVREDRLIMRVADQGEGFDYRAELHRKKGGNAVDEARKRYQEGGYGGLGIMLMLKCVHKVEYNRKGNQVTLTKFLGDAATKFEEEQKKEDKQEELAEKNASPEDDSITLQGGFEISGDDDDSTQGKEGGFVIEPD